MIRTPELKTQAAFLTSQIQEALGTKLGHGKALDIVAQLNGFKNWRHALAEETSVKPSSLSAEQPAQPARFEKKIIFGEEETRAYEDGAIDGLNPTTVSFATQAELNAYLEGVDEAIGWLNYAVVDDTGENSEANPESYKHLIPRLAEAGFTHHNNDRDYRRLIGDKGYQFMTFEVRGLERFIRMECVSAEEYFLTETPAYTGDSWVAALENALAAADAQVAEALANLEKADM